MDPTPTPAALLTRQFLAWVEAAPRSYAEAMDAWRSSCPRLSIWEDALAEGLLRIEPGAGGMAGQRLALTGAGRAALSGCGARAPR
jgi:hypothetical protein